MGQRYRHNYQETGDIIDPLFWVLDNNEMAGEVNGGMDRDNLAQADIAQAEIVDDSFVSVSSASSTTNYAPDTTVTTWQGGTATGASGIFYVTNVECKVDCVFDVRVHVSWQWSGANASYTATPYWYADTITFRLLVDGIEVCQAGPFEDMHDRYGTYLMGQLIVTAGFRTIAVECLVAKRRYEGLDIVGTTTEAPTITERYMLAKQEKR